MTPGTFWFRRSRRPLGVFLSLAAIILAGQPDSASASSRGHEFGKVVGWGVADGVEKVEVCSTNCKPGISGSGIGQLNTPTAVAVSEATGDFYVLDEVNGRVERFSTSGEYLGEFDGSGRFEVFEGGELKVKETGGAAPAGPLTEPVAIAVDNSCVQLKLSVSTCKAQDLSNGDVYVADGFPHKVIDKFTAVGEFIGQIMVPEPPEMLTGVSVDPSGALWVAENGLQNGHYGFERYDNAPANSSLKFVLDGESRHRLRPGFAVGREGVLYSNIVFESPFEHVIAAFSESGQDMGVVREEEASGVAVEPISGGVFADMTGEVGGIARFEPGVTPLTEAGARFGKEYLTSGRGVGVDSQVADGGPVYVSDAGKHDVAVFPLEGPKPPTVEGMSVSAVTSGSARLSAIVNPRGARTEYVAEIGVCISFETCSSAPFEPVSGGVGSVGSVNDFEGHEVNVHPQDLRPAVTYHFRVLARNEKNTPTYIEGEEVVFTAQPAAAPGRLDSREWELVSPGQKRGALIYPITGEGVIQAAASGKAITYRAAAPTEEEPKGYDSSVQVLSRRTAAGWMSEDIDTSHATSAGQSIGQGGDYRLFSADLSVGLVQPLGAYEPETSPEATEQTPYVRTDFLRGDVEAACASGCYQPLVTGEDAGGVVFGEEGHCPPNIICGPRVVGASLDGRHVVVSSPVGLVDGKEGGLFEWNEGRLVRVSVQEHGNIAPFSSVPEVGSGRRARAAVSEDGSRVVWSEALGAKHLYLWEAQGNESVELDKGLSGGQPVYQAASTDGSRVFFTYMRSLYVYEAESGRLVLLTTPVNNSERSEVEGQIAGISQNGSIIYLVADGKLSQAAPRNVVGCEKPTAVSRCYLYVIQQEGSEWSVPRVVAVLSGSDAPDFSSLLTDLTVGVAPNGEWLAFMSDLSLTGYDNRDAVSGARDEEVFLFNDTTGKLACVSCNPSGARPSGVQYAQLEGGLVSGDRVWPGSAWLAGSVPGWTPYSLGEAVYQSRFVLDDGRVFFNSSDALVPQDVNGVMDVYEFEPVGVGSCTEGSVTFSSRSGGCVGLVSSGTLAGESGFVDASASGSDVFFETANALVPSDRDSAVDVYDAHECSVVSPCLPQRVKEEVVCLTEASCKGEPSVQPESFGVPPSQLFSGLGNVAANPVRVVKPTRKQLLEKALASCRKAHPRSKGLRVVCEHHARARYAPVAKRTVRSGKPGAFGSV